MGEKLSTKPQARGESRAGREHSPLPPSTVCGGVSLPRLHSRIWMSISGSRFAPRPRVPCPGESLVEGPWVMR